MSLATHRVVMKEANAQARAIRLEWRDELYRRMRRHRELNPEQDWTNFGRAFGVSPKVARLAILGHE